MILFRYINIQIIKSILLVLLLLIGVQSFIQLSGQLQNVGKGDYGWGLVFLYVPLMLPSDIYQLFPMAALIGSLMGLGRLASRSELIVMRSSGLSKAQIVRSVLMGAFVLLIFITIIGEWLGPLARDKALNLKNEAVSSGKTLSTKHGMWVKDHQDFLHIQRILSSSQISGITRYRFDKNNKLILSSYASLGQYDRGRWTFYDVNQSEIFSDHVDKKHFKQQQWHFKIDPSHLGVHKVDPNQLSFLQLNDYIHFRKHSGLGVGIFEFVFWRRVFQPVATLVMILLAVPFIFGPLRSVPMGPRIVSGVVIGFVFYILNQFFGPFSLVYRLPPLIAAVMPILLFALVGLYLLLFRKN